MADVGISIFEGVASGVTPFIEASKHNIGLVMERERGVPNKAIRITSLQQDRKVFGGIVSTQYGAFVARHIFNNAGRFGAIVEGVRVVGTGSVAATGVLTDGAPSTQTLTKTTVTPQSVGVSEVSRFTPTNVSTGDQFTMTSGTDSVVYEAEAGDGVAEVVLGLKALIDAKVTSSDTDWTVATWSVGAGDAYIESTMVASATVNPVVATTVNGSAATIATFYAGYKGQQDPGTWGNNLVIKAYPKSDPLGVNGKYLVEIYLRGKLVESWEGATWTSIINTLNQFSEFVTVQAGTLAADILGIQTVTFTSGAYVAPTEADFYDSTNLTGLYALNGIDVQLLACTEHHTVTMAQAGLVYALSRRDCMYVANLPYLATSTTVETFSTALQSESVNSSFIAGYNCWVKTSDEANNFVWTPSIGCILGAGYVRVPQLNRDRVYMPPSGIEANFVDVVDISPNPIDPATLNDYTKNKTVNSVVYKKGKGFYIATSRTFCTNPLYHSVHIRRQTNFYVKTLQDNLEWASQKPNTPELKRQIYVQLFTFFREEYNDGGLENSVSYEKACQIISDKSNNPPTQDRKMLNTDVQWIPTECTESITIRLNRNDGILIAETI